MSRMIREWHASLRPLKVTHPSDFTNYSGPSFRSRRLHQGLPGDCHRCHLYHEAQAGQSHEGRLPTISFETFQPCSRSVLTQKLLRYLSIGPLP